MNYMPDDLSGEAAADDPSASRKGIALSMPGCDQSASPLKSAGMESALEEASSLRIRTFRPLPTPEELKADVPVSEAATATVAGTRSAIRDILAGSDPRLLVITGPCSIHDEASALEYAHRLRNLADRVSDRIVPVMRVYLENPRSAAGWKGLIHDPLRNGRGEIALGLHAARRILLEINEMGVPAASELLSPMTADYLADLIAWAAIGARTVESQTHRQMASGLSMPVGFKNSTDGRPETAINAMIAAMQPHTCFTIAPNGQPAVIRSRGNSWTHPVLRGGASPNYDAPSVLRYLTCMTKKGLPGRVMIDCSHGNSANDHRRQGRVFRDILEQRCGGNTAIIGLMLESHLHEGKQAFAYNPTPLRYGVSITDACISWEETERLVLEAYARLQIRRQ